MLSKAIRHIERAIKGDPIESETDEPAEKKRKHDSTSKSGSTPPRIQFAPRRLVGGAAVMKSSSPTQSQLKSKVAASKPSQKLKPKMLNRQNSNVSSTSNANSAASNEESDTAVSGSEGKVTPNEHRPVKKRDRSLKQEPPRENGKKDAF